MFRCAITGKVSRPGEKLHRVVVEVRKVAYRNRIRGGEGAMLDSTGEEIVKEIGVSAEGLAIFNARKQEASQ